MFAQFFLKNQLFLFDFEIVDFVKKRINPIQKFPWTFLDRTLYSPLGNAPRLSEFYFIMKALKERASKGSPQALITKYYYK